ncbi:hypothetical protein A2U01_0088634, partial [Trifolium medium]|nr:hypothetical protein [Trifolium medium]
MSGGFGGGLSALRAHEIGKIEWQVNLDISKKSGGLGGIASTYGEPALTK